MTTAAPRNRLRTALVEADGPFRQFLLFAMVGGAAAIVHYGTLIALAEGLSVTPVAASAAGFLIGGVVSYALNYSHVFHSERRHAPTVARFVAVAAVGLTLNSAILWALIHGAALHYLLAQIIATGLVMAWSFTANRYWTFGTGPAAP